MCLMAMWGGASESCWRRSADFRSGMERLSVQGGARGGPGTVAIPGDKSISHRAIILGALAEGVTEISGCLRSEDCQRSLGAFRALGVEAEGWEGDTIRVYGQG